MDNGINDRNGQRKFLSGVFEIPGWLLLLIAIVAILAAVLRITVPAYLWVLIILVLVLVGWFSRGGSPTTGPTRRISDPDAPGYTITLGNVPDRVASNLLKIDDRTASQNLDKDGVGEVLFISGNLVFNDTTNNNTLVTSFPSPIRVTINYTDADEQRRLERQNALGEEVRLIPVYLYSPVGKQDINIWKPFQNFRIDQASKTMTVEVLFWGDQQVGGGTKP